MRKLQDQNNYDPAVNIKHQIFQINYSAASSLSLSVAASPSHTPDGYHVDAKGVWDGDAVTEETAE